MTNKIKAAVTFVLAHVIAWSIIMYVPLGITGVLLIASTYPLCMGMTLHYLSK
jgi:hypothetical protein